VTRNRIARLNANGSLDTGFNPNADSTVNSLAVQADGKVLIGGSFTTVGGVTRNRVARLNADGSLDTGFNPNANGEVYSVAVQADGKVLIGGQFTTVGGVTRNRIARLNADGSLETGFNPNANNSVNNIVIQTDGKILIGGFFSSLGGVTSRSLARLNADGSLDTGFNNPFSSAVTVHSIVVQADGKVLIGGGFSDVSAVTLGRPVFIVRLNPGGSIDSGFYVETNNSVYGIAVQADGKILIGGNFTRVGATARNRIARLNADGSLDTVFDPNVSSTDIVFCFALQADGSVLVGGGGTLGGMARPGIARLVNNPATQSLAIPDATRVRWSRGGAGPELGEVVFEQSLDNGASWSLLGAGTRVGATADWELTGLSLSAGTKVRATGRSTSGGYYNGSGGVVRQVFPLSLPGLGSSPTASKATGTPGASAMSFSGTIDSDGGSAITERGFVYAVSATNAVPEIGGTGVTKLVASLTQVGSFTILASGLTPGTTYSYRSYATNSAGTTYSPVNTFTTAAYGGGVGEPDIGFNPDVSGVVIGIAAQADGKVLIGGTFTGVRGVTRNRIARLNADGSLDTGFNPNADFTVNGVAVQADGKVLIGGQFTTVGGVGRNRIARLNADGSLDTGFNPNVSTLGSVVNSIALQADGKVLIGGTFTTVGGVTRNRIARLNADGSLDTGFNPDANNELKSIAVQADGKVLIGGLFTSVGGVTRNRIARLNADGSLDAGFNPDAGNTVTSIALQADGKVLIGGTFISVGGTQRLNIARLANDPATQNLTTPDATRVRWSRGGTAPEVGNVVFEQSLDNGESWSLLGIGARVGVTSAWELTGLSLSAGARVRATGRVSGGQNNASSGLVRREYPVTVPGVSSSVTASAITGTAATPAMSLAGSIFSDGGTAITERGFVYAVSASNPTPEIGGAGVTKLIASGKEVGSFSALVQRLSPGTSYSYRSYATNAAGTSYSTVQSFTAAAFGTVAGDLDTGFNPAVSPSVVHSVAVQADGKALIGGAFVSVGGVTRNRIARLNANGRLDTGFNPNA
jgi:uncharacterized delta-60 repeat protein